MNKSKSGFTIVELLIVIVVIAILAAITIVAYNGIQQRANDTTRMQDVASIRKALEQYKILNGGYPAATNTNSAYAGWEVSLDSTWLSSLSSVAPSLPKDPINDATSHYEYFKSAAGTQGCPASAGAFYVLRVTNLQTFNGVEVSDLSACAGSTSLSSSRTPSATRAVFFGFEG